MAPPVRFEAICPPLTSCEISQAFGFDPPIKPGIAPEKTSVARRAASFVYRSGIEILGGVGDALWGALTFPDKAFKYWTGVDQRLGQDRPWSFSNLGRHLDGSLQGNPLFRIGDTAGHIFYGALNTVTGAIPHRVFNQWLGLNIEYFAPPPQTLRENSQWVANGILAMAPLRGPVAKAMANRAGAISRQSAPVFELGGEKMGKIEFIDLSEKLSSSKNSLSSGSENIAGTSPVTGNTFRYQASSHRQGGTGGLQIVESRTSIIPVTAEAGLCRTPEVLPTESLAYDSSSRSIRAFGGKIGQEPQSYPTSFPLEPLIDPKIHPVMEKILVPGMDQNVESIGDPAGDRQSILDAPVNEANDRQYFISILHDLNGNALSEEDQRLVEKILEKRQGLRLLLKDAGDKAAVREELLRLVFAEVEDLKAQAQEVLRAKRFHFIEELLPHIPGEYKTSAIAGANLVLEQVRGLGELDEGFIELAAGKLRNRYPENEAPSEELQEKFRGMMRTAVDIYVRSYFPHAGGAIKLAKDLGFSDRVFLWGLRHSFPGIPSQEIKESFRAIDTFLPEADLALRQTVFAKIAQGKLSTREADNIALQLASGNITLQLTSEPWDFFVVHERWPLRSEDASALALYFGLTDPQFLEEAKSQAFEGIYAEDARQIFQRIDAYLPRDFVAGREAMFLQVISGSISREAAEQWVQERIDEGAMAEVFAPGLDGTRYQIQPYQPEIDTFSPATHYARPVSAQWKDSRRKDTVVVEFEISNRTNAAVSRLSLTLAVEQAAVLNIPLTPEGRIHPSDEKFETQYAIRLAPNHPAQNTGPIKKGSSDPHLTAIFPFIAAGLSSLFNEGTANAATHAPLLSGLDLGDGFGLLPLLVLGMAFFKKAPSEAEARRLVERELQEAQRTAGGFLPWREISESPAEASEWTVEQLMEQIGAGYLEGLDSLVSRAAISEEALTALYDITLKMELPDETKIMALRSLGDLHEKGVHGAFELLAKAAREGAEAVAALSLLAEKGDERARLELGILAERDSNAIFALLEVAERGYIDAFERLSAVAKKRWQKQAGDPQVLGIVFELNRLAMLGHEAALRAMFEIAQYNSAAGKYLFHFIETLGEKGSPLPEMPKDFLDASTLQSLYEQALQALRAYSLRGNNTVWPKKKPGPSGGIISALALGGGALFSSGSVQAAIVDGTVSIDRASSFPTASLLVLGVVAMAASGGERLFERFLDWCYSKFLPLKRISENETQNEKREREKSELRSQKTSILDRLMIMKAWTEHPFEEGSQLMRRMAVNKKEGPWLRMQAIWALGKISDLASAPLIAAILNDTRAPHNVRREAAVALKNMPSPESVEAFLKVLEDPSEFLEMRLAALSYFMIHWDPKAEPVLQWVAQDVRSTSTLANLAHNLLKEKNDARPD